MEDEDEKFSSKILDNHEEHVEEFDNLVNFDCEDESNYAMSTVHEKDVVVLKEGNFIDFVSKCYVLVKFYVSWCGHCQALALEYAAAVTDLKGEVTLAKGDAAEENDLVEKFSV